MNSMTDNNMVNPTNKLAVTSFMVGFLAAILSIYSYFLVGVLFGAVALIAGIAAFIQIRKQGGKGKEWATAGIVLSFSPPLIYVLLSVVGNLFYQ
jgi:uncharacterized membrane protein HdeD (DUF308 family)